MTDARGKRDLKSSLIQEDTALAKKKKRKQTILIIKSFRTGCRLQDLFEGFTSECQVFEEILKSINLVTFT